MGVEAEGVTVAVSNGVDGGVAGGVGGGLKARDGEAEVVRKGGCEVGGGDATAGVGEVAGEEVVGAGLDPPMPNDTVVKLEFQFPSWLDGTPYRLVS